jgi:acyl carrier protein
MEINDFIQKFADQLDDTDVSQLTPETEFRDIEEWSSIIGLSIILMVDEEYGITLEAADIQKANTIEELFNIVQEKA